jgi:hypothetical protein
MELPSHPERADEPATDPPAPIAGPARRTTRIALIAVGVVLAVILVLHLTGVMGPAR